jgi:hypothetical protein
MNERIKEITVQALENSLFEPIDPTVTVGEGENKVSIPLVFIDNFAKLIIEECARRCDVVRENEGGDKKFGARLCADEIRYLNRRS